MTTLRGALGAVRLRRTGAILFKLVGECLANLRFATAGLYSAFDSRSVSVLFENREGPVSLGNRSNIALAKFRFA